MTNSAGFSSLWEELEPILTGVPSTPTVFNQYRDCNEQVDLQTAPSTRLQNLKKYMEQALKTASVLVVGEAAGPWGCRFSGVPFMGERQLLDSTFPYKGERSSRSKTARPTRVDPPYISTSAEIFWRLMLQFHTQILVWDAFPLHTHKCHDIFSVRNPTTTEVAGFRGALHLIKAYMKPVQIVAIGRKADKILSTIGELHQYVRHPSRGGNAKFTAGMEVIFIDQRKDR